MRWSIRIPKTHKPWAYGIVGVFSEIGSSAQQNRIGSWTQNTVHSLPFGYGWSPEKRSVAFKRNWTVARWLQMASRWTDCLLPVRQEGSAVAGHMATTRSRGLVWAVVYLPAAQLGEH